MFNLETCLVSTWVSVAILALTDPLYVLQTWSKSAEAAPTAAKFLAAMIPFRSVLCWSSFYTRRKKHLWKTPFLSDVALLEWNAH